MFGLNKQIDIIKLSKQKNLPEYDLVSNVSKGMKVSIVLLLFGVGYYNFLILLHQ